MRAEKIPTDANKNQTYQKKDGWRLVGERYRLRVYSRIIEKATVPWRMNGRKFTFAI